jgi:transcriptional repressor of dcmA and dcmR
MSKLMTIKEAANYLSVSEMSLRRWTNSGKLKCLRVGKKNERRFRKEDLIAYMSGGAPPPAKELKLPEDSHIAHFYKTDNEGMEISLNAIKKGLDKGEIVVAIVPPKKGTLLRKKLNAQGILVEILEAQQILTISAGCQTPEEQIAFVDQLIKRARHFNGFRLVGDMVWTREKNWDSEMVHTLEQLTNQQRKNIPAKYICQYQVDEFSRDETFLAMQTHNYTIYNGKLNPCPYYKLASKWAPVT